jgi:hypothetical protein
VSGTFSCDPAVKETCNYYGGYGELAHHPFLISRQCNLGSHEVKHEFLYLPDCPMAEVDKFTLGQELTVWIPHSVLTFMEYQGNYWLTNSQMVKYQSMLCENL